MTDGPTITGTAVFGSTVPWPGGTIVAGPFITGTAVFTGDAWRDSTRQDWVARLVSNDGQIVAEMHNAVVTEIRQTLNGIDSATATIPVGDPAAEPLLDTILPPPNVELHIRHGERNVFFGPVVRTTVADGTLNIGAKGAPWHLARRRVGRSHTNLLTNPNFDRGLKGWKRIKGTFNAAFWVTFSPPSAGEFTTITTTTHQGSPRAAKITPGADADTYYQLYQDAVLTAPDEAALPVDLVAWYYLPVGSPPQEQGRGLLLQLLEENPSLGLPLAYYGQSLDEHRVNIDSDAPQGVWQRLVASVEIPAGTTRRIHATLGVPGPSPGAIVWGAAALYAGTGLYYRDTDQAAIVRGLVAHAQDTDYAKTDANIAATTSSCPNTGVRRDRTYLHGDHAPIWRAITEMADAVGGFDISCQVSTTARKIRVHYPRKGTHKPRAHLTIEGPGANCRLLRWAADGEAAATRVWYIASAGGWSREEGLAEGGDGVTLEDLVTADRETGTDALDGLAAGRLAATTNPKTITVETYAGTMHVDGFAVGDTTTAYGQIGYLTIDGTWRCVERAIDPVANTVTLTLNQWSTG